MSVVYWIKNDSCKNPCTDGYVGVTDYPKIRFRVHQSTKRFPSDSVFHILLEDTRNKCLEREKELRPIQEIGWNKAPGGGGNHSKMKPSYFGELKRQEKLAYYAAGNKGYWAGKTRPEQSKFMKQNSPSTRPDVATKISNAAKGSGNSQYGAVWITDGVTNVITKNAIPDGWYRGRPFRNFNVKD